MVHSTDIKRLRQEYRDTKNKSEMYERNKAKIKAHDYTSPRCMGRTRGIASWYIWCVKSNA